MYMYDAYVSRFGSFEIFKTRDRMTGRVGPSVGRADILDQLLDFTTQNYYPQVQLCVCIQYIIFLQIFNQHS